MLFCAYLNFKTIVTRSHHKNLLVPSFSQEFVNVFKKEKRDGCNVLLALFLVQMQKNHNTIKPFLEHIKTDTMERRCNNPD